MSIGKILEDEGGRCPFLLENDDSKIVTCMCNYYSLGQAELARALLHIVASRSLPRALRIVKTIIWHGPPKHWLCSAFAPSSAHVAWLCLIDFQDLVETHLQRPACLPPWLLRRLEFDVLIAQALLDGAAIQAQVLTAEVATELRAYHAGLLCATSRQGSLAPELQVPSTFKLPALSLLQVTNQVSPYVNFLPAHTTDRQEQLEHFGSGAAALSKSAVQQLYELCKSQPLLGRCISRALAPPGCLAAVSTARRIQQLCLGLTADALLQSLKGDAWRYLKFLEVSDVVGIPPALLELFSILLIVVISDVRPTPALHSRLQALVAMATCTINAGGTSPGGGSGAAGNGSEAGALNPQLDGGGGGPATPRSPDGFDGSVAPPPSGAVDGGDGGAAAVASAAPGIAGGNLAVGAGPGIDAVALLGAAHTGACRTLAEMFAQAMHAEGGSASVKPWDHFRQLLAVRGGTSEAYRVSATSSGKTVSKQPSVGFSKFLNRIRGGDPELPAGENEGLAKVATLEHVDDHLRGDDRRRDGGSAWHQISEAEEGPVEAARTALLHRTKIYEAFLTHESGGAYTALRLFSVLEDEFLRLKSAQSPLPPAFELLQPLGADSYRFHMPPITFWDAYFEFTRVEGAHCLEYVVQTAVKFIRDHDFCASAWLLAPFPQLKPLVILLCWPEFRGDVDSRQSLLDTLWKSYTRETQQDPTKTGDLLVDYWVEVLDYRLSVSWWISKLVLDQGQAALTQGSSTSKYKGTAAPDTNAKSARGRGKDSAVVAGAGSRNQQDEAPRNSLSNIAAEVLNQVTSHSILYVMRPNLPMVRSDTLLSALQSLPPLRQSAAAQENSYDLDLTRCYYAVRCVMSTVARCVRPQGTKGTYEDLTPERHVIEDGMREVDRLISSIERTPLKVSVFLLISSLCFVRHRHLQGDRKGSRQTLGPASLGEGRVSDFLVPPSVLLSLLSLLRHHLRPLASRAGANAGAAEVRSSEPIEGADEHLLGIIACLHRFTQESIWRIFIGLKDFFSYSLLTPLGDSIHLKPAQRLALFEQGEGAAVEWAQAVGAVITGDIELEEFFNEMCVVGKNEENNSGTRTVSDNLGLACLGAESNGGVAGPGDHLFLKFCTPMEVPLSLQPSTFVPRMLAGPVMLLHRSLKMNDYLLSRRLLQHFPVLRGGAIESTVKIAEKFKDLRQSLSSSRLEVEAEDVLSDEFLDTQLGSTFEINLHEIKDAIQCQEPGAHMADGVAALGKDDVGEETALLASLSGPLLEFYCLVDLAISAARFSQLSTHLLKKASPCLTNEGLHQVADGALLPISDSLRSFFQNWIARLSVLVEVRPEFKGRVSLANIILGIETLPSEPALLKSHLSKLHSHRHAIMSLVEGIDLVKKGQTSAWQGTSIDFLSAAIKSLTSEEEERAGVDNADAQNRDDAEHMAESLRASRYLLRFLEYLAKVADLKNSASMEARTRKAKRTQKIERMKLRNAPDSSLDTSIMERLGDSEEGIEVTKLFDVLAESPKGIVARLLFELGGHRQALMLSEIMNVDLVEVIVNSSWRLPSWTEPPGKKEVMQTLRENGPAWSQYPMSMEVVLYLAQHESPLPQVRVSEAPLLATMACLERRGAYWPSWRMLQYAKDQSEHRFPSLHRWVEERCHALRAIQWAGSMAAGGVGVVDRRAFGLSGLRPASPSSASLLDDQNEAEDDRGGDDDNDAESVGEEKAAKQDAACGYTDEELQHLNVDDQLALEAVGDDHEAGMSASYTKLVHALNGEQRYEEALQVCDEYLPFDNALTDQVLHMYLNSTQGTDHQEQQRELTPFVTRAELLDHECMYRLKKHSLAARLTLERYRRWDVDTAVQTVSMCLQRMEAHVGPEQSGEARDLRQELTRILEKMVTFEKILQVSGGRWRIWQEIEDMQEVEVHDAVAHLLELQQHDLARTLTKMYGMTDPLHSLELSRLNYLFTNKDDKTSAVNRLLSLPPAQAVSFAFQLLNMFDLIQHRVLLCQMLLTRLHSWLSAEEDQSLRVLHASLQLLGTVSDTMQPHFLRVLRKPALIVESLLMNARVDLLEPFLADFPEYRHDELILRYARKALALSPDPPDALGGSGASAAAARGPAGLVNGSTAEEDLLDVEAEDPLSLEAAAEGDDGRTACAGGDGEGRGMGGLWCLTGALREDRRIRDEHAFQMAPSISLAEKILELCSDRPENASKCFDICNELSLRLHELTPRYSVTSGTFGNEDHVLATKDASPTIVSQVGIYAQSGALQLGYDVQPQSPGAPLSSVRLVTLLIRRLLIYLQKKFRGVGAEIKLQLDRSLNHLDFIPLIWQISGHRVGLSHLCNPRLAAELRNKLVAEDQLSLALELCERCGGERRTVGADSPRNNVVSYTQDNDASWHISADPVREAKAVALQKLHRYGEARQEFSQTESTAPQAAKTALASFENAMRYPPLFDLAALEHARSLYTFNSLQRKLYRSTAPLPSLPLFLFSGNKASESGANSMDSAPTGAQKRTALQPPLVSQREHVPGLETELSRPLRGVGRTGAQFGYRPTGTGVQFGGSPTTTPDEPAGSYAAMGQGAAELRVLEERLRDSARAMKERRRARQELHSAAGRPPPEAGPSAPGADGALSVTGGAVGTGASTAGSTASSTAGAVNSAETATANAAGAGASAVNPHSRDADATDGEKETLFVNGIAFLCPPIHPPEMPSWSALYDVPKSNSRGGKAHVAKEALVGEAPPEEGLAPRPPSGHQGPEDKDRNAEEAAVVGAGEVEADGEKNRDEEGEKRDTMPEVSYEQLMMQMTRICCGCAASTNLRSQSNLWPDDNHTHSLMPASPMALPLAVPLVLVGSGERQLSDLSFNELLHYQENYGTAESLLSMLVRERHLAQACYYIFNEKVSKRLFVDVVAHHCLAHNQFHELQRVILDFDPSLRRVQEYLNVLKDFLRDRRALDLLYSYQVFTKDFVNSGLLAIQLFIASGTWDARVGHLQNAYAHLSVAHKQLFGRKRGHHPDLKEESGRDGTAETATLVSSADGVVHSGVGETVVDGISGLEITEGDIRRNLETVKIQMAICDAMPTDMPHNLDLFGPMASQCEVAERLLVAGHFDLAQRVIEFLDLPRVELCVRASNQIATVDARSHTGSIAPVMRFLEAIPKLPPVEWDSLVSNVINIWIIEKAELKADPSAAGQLIRFIHDERCRMDAHVLTGNLTSAFQIAQRLGNLHDILHIRSCAQKGGDQELLKHINTFLAYTSPGRDYLTKSLQM